MCDIIIAKAYLQKFENAKSARVDFNLSFTSYKNLHRAKKCYYTGIQMTDPVRHEKLRLTDRTIDRIDNTKGYETGNCVACCHAANNLKAQIEQPNNIIDKKFLEKFIAKV